MGFINQFPYSDFHEMNLDWLITTMKAVRAQMDAIQEEFDKIEVMTKEQIELLIQEAILTNNRELYNYLNQLKAQITAEDNAYTDTQITTLRSYTDNEITSLRSYTDNQITSVNNNISDLKIYVDNQDVFYDDLAKVYADHAVVVANQYTDDKVINYTYMISPITGEYEDIRDVINEMIDYFHSDKSLTAAEYDALDLTASAYDAYALTAFDYDFYGKILLV